MALLAAYSFDEAGGKVTDYSGNGRDWTLNNNAVRSETGHTAGGITKDGVGLPVVVASPSFVGSNAWSFMFWQQGLGNAVWWLRLYNSSADTGSGLLDIEGDFRLRLRTAGGSNVETPFMSLPSDGGWHHYAGTYDGTVGRVYVDGVLQGTTDPAPAPLAQVDHIDMMEFTLSNAFRDDLRFFDDALDATAITTWMNTPVTETAVEDITGALDATVSLAGELTAIPADLAGSFSLTLGLAGGLEVPVPDLTGTLTLEASPAGTLDVPTASIPDLSGSAAVAVSLMGSLRDPSEPTELGTYSAEVDRPTHSAAVILLEHTAEVGV